MSYSYLGADAVKQTAHHAFMPTAYDKAVALMRSNLEARADARPYINQVAAFLNDFVAIAEELGRAPRYRAVAGTGGWLSSDAEFLQKLTQRGWVAPAKPFLALAYDNVRGSLLQPMLDPARYARENIGVDSSVIPELKNIIETPIKAAGYTASLGVKAVTNVGGAVISPITSSVRTLVMLGLGAYVLVKISQRGKK